MLQHIAIKQLYNSANSTMDLQSLIAKKKANLKPCKTVVTNELGERYEIVDGNRTKISQVLPFVVDSKPDLQVARVLRGLFLSSQDAAVSIDLLNEHHIRHILSVGIDLTLKFDHIKYHYFELLDLPETDILPTLQRCIQIIHQNLHENVLVHCNAGVSRSATIVISYLMIVRNMSYEDAYEKVRSARSCIKPNEGFVKQLKTLENRHLDWKSYDVTSN